LIFPCEAGICSVHVQEGRGVVGEGRGESRAQAGETRLPGSPKHVWIFVLIFTLMSLGFMCFGIFAMEGGPLPEKKEGASYVSNLVFSLFSNGFRGIWLLMTTVFTGLGIFILVRAIIWGK